LGSAQFRCSAAYGAEESSTKEIEFASAVHLPPDEFELGDVSRPELGERRCDRGMIGNESIVQ
jgi:hypothetical protein